MIISKTPLRVSLCGGGTDFENFYKVHGGCVISFAINKYIYVIVKERFDDLIVLNYTQHEIVERISDIKHDLIREVLGWSGIEGGIEITTLADIPSKGSGLGSSSAVTVGLINAISHYMGNSLTAKSLADDACDIEIAILKNPIGKQDQYACAYGGFNKINFVKDNIYVFPYRKWQYHIGNNLFLHFTGAIRSASSILSEQNNNIPNNIELLLTIKGITESFDADLKLDLYDNVGDSIKSSWEIKKELATGISSRDIDKMVEMSLAGGATGCKICGAGGGGFLLSYVPPENQIRFRKSMSIYRELPFNIDPYGSRIIFNIT